LSYIERLFMDIDAAQLRYCHWKSNEHLHDGLGGKTDLDVLTDWHDAVEFRRILSERGWIQARPRTSIGGVEDWIGCDETDGRLYHIHLHTIIPLGSGKAKIYTLPLENWVLESRVRSGRVWIAAPQSELFLLILRLALKTTIRR